MNLVDLTAKLATLNTVVELDHFVGLHGSQLTLALWQLDTSTPGNIELLDNAHNAFYSSGAGKEVDEQRAYSEGVNHILQLLGTAYERIGHSGIRRIAADIQDTALRKRFTALHTIRNQTGFSQRGFIEKFPKIMRLLSEARYDDIDNSIDYTGNVLRIIHLYKSLGSKYFRVHFPSALAEFDALFSNPANLTAWPLLAEYAEPTIDLPATAAPFDFSKAIALPIEPSALAEDLFERCITQPLRSKSPRGHLSKPLGYDTYYIKNKIIENGTANFRKSFEAYDGKIISPADRVLLYCHFNLRVHYFSSYYIYSVYLSAFNKDRLGFTEKLFFLDLGCGPLTSGLAIADLFLQKYGTAINMNYIGVDIARVMLDKATELKDNAPALFASTKFNFVQTFTDALKLITDKLFFYNHTLIINTSYLFASSSLNVDELAAFLIQIRVICEKAAIHIVFQNPDKKDRNSKYVEWKKKLEPSGLEIVARDISRVRYALRRGTSETTSEPIFYELLSY